MSTAELHRQHIERDIRLEQRVARMVMEGEVVGWRPQDNRVQLALGEDPHSGERVLSPWVRVPSFGNGGEGGGLRLRITPRVGQKMVLLSPSGRVGPQSVTMFAPFNPDENPANSAEAQELRLDVGQARLTVRGDLAELKLGDGIVRIENDKVTVSKGDAKVELTADKIKGFIGTLMSVVKKDSHVAIKDTSDPKLHFTVDKENTRLIYGMQPVIVPDPYAGD